MKLIALMPVRNEDWVLGLSLRALLMWCDEAVILDHASTDRTPEILREIDAEYPGRLTIITETDPTWREMSHRHRLLTTAREHGATHCAMVDADEVLTGNLLPKIQQFINALRPCGMLRCALPCITGAIDQYRADRSIWAKAETTVAFADCAALCWQAPHDGYDFHHREPYGARPQSRIPREFGGLMHLQFVYRRRLVAKHALYKMTEVIRWPGREPVPIVEQRYNQAPDWTGMQTAKTPAEWWAPYQHLMQHLDTTHEPWHEAEVRRLMAVHGADKFKGLTLFGLA